MILLLHHLTPATACHTRSLPNWANILASGASQKFFLICYFLFGYPIKEGGQLFWLSLDLRGG
jgi:hypothetical protein